MYPLTNTLLFAGWLKYLPEIMNSQPASTCVWTERRQHQTEETKGNILMKRLWDLDSHRQSVQPGARHIKSFRPFLLLKKQQKRRKSRLSCLIYRRTDTVVHAQSLDCGALTYNHVKNCYWYSSSLTQEMLPQRASRGNMLGSSTGLRSTEIHPSGSTQA